MKTKRKPTTKKPQALPAVIDILRGRIPVMEDPIRYYITLFIVVGFWVFVICIIGGWTLSIPGILNLPDLISKLTRSP